MSENIKKQVGGDHYKKYGNYQPWQVFPKWFTPEELKGYMKGEVIAYLCREADKGGFSDIKKAHHVLGLYIDAVEETESGVDNDSTPELSKEETEHALGVQ